jgi:hypothetical protein
MLTVEPSVKASRSANWYTLFIRSIEGAYFGIVAFSIAISGIFGGVALAFIFQRSGPLWQLFVSIVLVLGNMIIPVAQQKLKPIISLFLISIGINSLFILYYLFRDGFY